MGKKGGEAVGKYLTPFCYMSILVALAVALFSQEIITIMTPPQYHGAIDIAIVLSMLYGSYFFGKQPHLIFAKKTWITSAFTLVGIVLNILINIPFIIKWGAIGAAWATFIAAVILFPISFAVNQHYYEIKWEYKKIGSIFFIFFTSSMLIILMRYFFVGYKYQLAFKCVSAFSYIYLGIKLKVVTKENYRLIKNVIFPIKAVKPDCV